MANLEPLLHIQNPAIFRIQDIFITLSRYILAYSEHCVMLTDWESCHIQTFDTFRILAYLGPKVYSGIFNNNSYNNISFLFFTLILHTF